VKAQLHERLKNQKFRENLNALINQLREKADIEILIFASELLNPIRRTESETKATACSN
jgi:hypothetical protein